MNVIITGGTGLIGRNLAADLANHGHQAIILSRNPDRLSRHLPDRVRLVAWDGKTSQGWGQMVNEAEAIVNLAGENIAAGPWTATRKKLIIESRLNAGQAIAQAIELARRRSQVIIQSSAVGYYGPHRDELITEETPPGNDFLSQVCIAWERSTQAVEDYDLRRCIIRTGVVLDGQDGALPRMVLPFRFFAGGPIGSGEQYFPWLHRDDVTAAIRFLIENPNARGAFNLSTPNPPTNRQFAAAIGQALGRPSWFPVPGFVLKTIFGEMATVLLDGQRAIPARLQELGFQFRYPEAKSAIRTLYS